MTTLNKRGNPIWYHDINEKIICRSCWDKKKYWKDPDKSRARVREYNRLNHDERYAYDRKYKVENVEILRQRRIDYYYKHREDEIHKRIRYRRLNGETATKRRKDLIRLLGGRCVECGYYTDIRALCVDHINGGGREDRKKFIGPLAYYRYYVVNTEEAKLKLQVLCANCNVIKMSIKKEYWKGGLFPKPCVTIKQ